MDNSEQWLLDGYCDECRKKAYCKNDCKRARERKQQELGNIICQHLSRTEGGRAMINIISNLSQCSVIR